MTDDDLWHDPEQLYEETSAEKFEREEYPKMAIELVQVTAGFSVSFGLFHYDITGAIVAVLAGIAVMAAFDLLRWIVLGWDPSEVSG